MLNKIKKYTFVFAVFFFAAIMLMLVNYKPADADENISLEDAKAQLSLAQEEYNNQISQLDDTKQKIDQCKSSAMTAQNIKFEKQNLKKM